MLASRPLRLPERARRRTDVVSAVRLTRCVKFLTMSRSWGVGLPWAACSDRSV